MGENGIRDRYRPGLERVGRYPTTILSVTAQKFLTLKKKLGCSMCMKVGEE
jgi:hypothetical protein